MGIQEKIREIEEEYKRTQKNKATEFHLGLLKAKLAKLRKQLNEREGSRSGGGSGGFNVRRTGDATVALIGLPSVGKSTLLNALTKTTNSKTGAYAFTTLTCIPGMLNYNGAKIQILDLPGIITGARSGKGRGREILSCARNADLVLIVLDVFNPNHLGAIKKELEGIGIRLDQKPPDIHFSKSIRGGLTITKTVKLTKIDERTIKKIFAEYGIYNGTLVIREDITVDQLIDYLLKNRRYIPSLIVLNKVDLVKSDYLEKFDFDFIPVSADKRENIELLKKRIYEKLNMIRIYTKPRKGEADLSEPMMMKKGATVGDVCKALHKDLYKRFRYAQVNGKSVKFPNQKVGLNHVLEDGDIITIVSKVI